MNKTLFIFLASFMTISITAFSQTQLGSDIYGEALYDQSGYSVSLSSDGSRIAIGAAYNDGSASDAGSVRIYEYSSGSWTQLGGDIDGEAAGDRLGHSVSLSSNGNRVAIGAPYNDGNGTTSGHVRLYDWDGSTWTQLGSDIDGEAVNDRLGYSVSLSSDGSRVAIGGPYNSGNGVAAGYTEVYSWNGTTWTQLGSDIDGEAAYDQSGESVSLSPDGSRVAIGAIYNAYNGEEQGHVRVYEWSGTAWSQTGSDIDGNAGGDLFGYSVSLSSDGSRIAIGANRNDDNGTNSGQVQIYEYSSGSWTQLGGNIDGEAAGDESGCSVSLSSDGSRVVIGGHYNDVNGSNSGHARIYYWNGSIWTQLGSDIDGDAANDRLGFSVSLSSDGSRVATGANFNDAGGTSAGQAQVFSFSNLPVELTYFKGKSTREGILLEWQTASEINNKGFHIQRSTNGQDWQIIGFVQGQGTTQDIQNYAYTDLVPQTDVNYYRLKQVDFDEKYEYTNVVNVEILLSSEVFKIFPNPIMDELNIINGQGIATIYNALGQQIKEFSVNEDELSINVSDLPKGQYWLSIIQENENVITQKFVK